MSAGEPHTSNAWRKYSWAVHHKAGKLRRKINQFFTIIKANGEYAEIYDRYFSNLKMFDYVDVRSYHRRLRTRLPSYQPIIEQAAELNNFDWRLIAAQIYQESHFDPAARSHARDLARQFNLDPNRWASLKETLPLLRYRKYYKNSRYGYCRGTEPINYVRHIFFYYDILKRSGIEYGRIHDPAGSGAL